jgi:iron(III) transport system ATP-binding protein
VEPVTEKLILSNVKKSFGQTSVLTNVSFAVTDGSLLTILGASGGGKTTLLRLIAGFETLDAGSIVMNGREVSSSDMSVPPEKRNVGFVPQESALFPHLSAKKNIGYGLSHLNSKARNDRIAELLDLIGMSELGDSMPDKLSGGQRQRVAIARALAPNPDILLLDEPFAALDAQLRSRLRDDVRAILSKAKATAILVTHDQEEALSIADQVAILRDGTVAQIGSPRSIYSQPIDVELAKFLGDAVVVSGVIQNGKVSTQLGDLIPIVSHAEGLVGQVAIRPENLYLQPDPKGLATVTARQYFGHDALVEVKTAAGIVKARTSGPISPEIGMRVTVWVRGSVNFYATD